MLNTLKFACKMVITELKLLQIINLVKTDHSQINVIVVDNIYFKLLEDCNINCTLYRKL